jgi:hypothetical protein
MFRFVSSWRSAPKARQTPQPRRPRLEVLEDRCTPAPIGTPTQNFVEQVYRDVLHRAADPTGLAGWSQGIDSGQVTRQQFVLDIRGSAEGLGTEVNDLYLRFLHRAADPTALAGWPPFLSNHSDIDLTAQLVGSQEYYLTRGGGTDAGFITAVYEDVLCRTPSAAEIAAWEAELSTTGTNQTAAQRRVSVALQILTSPEGRADQVSGYYISYLRRQADPLGLASGTQLLLNSGDTGNGGNTPSGSGTPDSVRNNPDAALVAALLSSPEYFQDAQTLTTFATIPSCGMGPGISIPGITS